MPSVKICISLPDDILAQLQQIDTLEGTGISGAIAQLLQTKHLIGHVMQRGEFDCGIAAVAMATSEAFETTITRSLNKCQTKGLSVAQCVELLKSSDSRWSRLSSPTWEMALAAKISVVLIRERTQQYGHWVFVKGGIIYDPEAWCGRGIADYCRRDWIVLQVMQRKP